MKAEQITLARELLRLTQAELALVLDVHEQTVSKWERGVLAPSDLQLRLFEGVLGFAAKNAENNWLQHETRCIQQMVDRRALLSAAACVYTLASIGHTPHGKPGLSMPGQEVKQSRA